VASGRQAHALDHSRTIAHPPTEGLGPSAPGPGFVRNVLHSIRKIRGRALGGAPAPAPAGLRPSSGLRRTPKARSNVLTDRYFFSRNGGPLHVGFFYSTRWRPMEAGSDGGAGRGRPVRAPPQRPRWAPPQVPIPARAMGSVKSAIANSRRGDPQGAQPGR
jgi:hypothetical protein